MAEPEIVTQSQTRTAEGLAITWEAVPGAIRYGCIVGFADTPVPPLSAIMRGEAHDFAILGIPARFSGAVDLGSPVGEERQYGLIAYRSDGSIVTVPNLLFYGARSAPRDREYHSLLPPQLVRSQPPAPPRPDAAPGPRSPGPRAPDPWQALETPPREEPAAAPSGPAARSTPGSLAAPDSAAPTATTSPPPTSPAPETTPDEIMPAQPAAASAPDPWDMLSTGPAPRPATAARTAPSVEAATAPRAVPDVPPTRDEPAVAPTAGAGKPDASLSASLVPPPTGQAGAASPVAPPVLDVAHGVPGAHASPSGPAQDGGTTAREARAAPAEAPLDRSVAEKQDARDAAVPADGYASDAEAPAGVDATAPSGDAPRTDMRDGVPEVVAEQPVAAAGPRDARDVEVEALPPTRNDGSAHRDTLPRVQAVPAEARPADEASASGAPAGRGPASGTPAPAVSSAEEPARQEWQPPTPAMAEPVRAAAPVQAPVTEPPRPQPAPRPLDPSQAASLAALLDEAELCLLPSWLDYDSAGRLLDQAAAIAASHPRLRDLRRRLQEAQGLGDASGENVEAILQQAQQCLERQEYWQAVDLYEEVLAQQPNDEAARRGSERARDLARWAAEMAGAGTEPERLQAIGAEFAATAPDLAAQAYAGAFQARPTIIALRSWLVALADSGQPEATLQVARRGVATLQGAGRVRPAAGQDEALAALQRQIEVRPQPVEVEAAVERLVQVLVAATHSERR